MKASCRSSVRVSAVVPSAGTGSRLRSKVHKPLVRLNTVPLFIWTLAAIKSAYDFESIIVPANPTDISTMRKCARNYGLSDIIFVKGGKTRSASVRNGLRHIKYSDGFVLVHDVARPFVSGKDVRQVIRSALRTGASVLALGSTATVKEVFAGTKLIRRTLDRKNIFLAQTPQVFKMSLLKKAYKISRNPSLNITDEAALVEMIPHNVFIVAGSSDNIKITTPGDIKIAEVMISRKKNGFAGVLSG